MCVGVWVCGWVWVGGGADHLDVGSVVRAQHILEGRQGEIHAPVHALHGQLWARDKRVTEASNG